VFKPHTTAITVYFRCLSLRLRMQKCLGQHKFLSALPRPQAGPFAIEELIRLSRSASHTKQPAVMGLVPIDLRGDDSPDLKTESGSTQELALAIVVITPKKQEEDHRTNSTRDRSGHLIYSVVPSGLSVVPNGSA
jgi:hypothetical protein